jgi:hypothetical protein
LPTIGTSVCAGAFDRRTKEPGAVDLVLRGGRVLRLTAGFTTATLRAVLTVLEDLPC